VSSSLSASFCRRAILLESFFALAATRLSNDLILAGVGSSVVLTLFFSLKLIVRRDKGDPRPVWPSLRFIGLPLAIGLPHPLETKLQTWSGESVMNSSSTAPNDLLAFALSRSAAGSRPAAISPSTRLASALAKVEVISPCRPMVTRRVRPLRPPS
jgi:hypothetical protein